ncbi:hypothetical protein [Couchioplanes azureus]|uniref:hypothetical protein n=1 Tax=Couchioplanes caeruleus TaxID=56438 RepID=UPI00166FCADB|nr:hypothetical protein [Couchioplanes caeruleus]GGQ85632.1 hypothetical protein GCM10010166_64980 [Couchioplanes caeruleus subsp. azureus]
MALPYRPAAFSAALLLASTALAVTAGPASPAAAADAAVVLRPDGDVVREWSSGTPGPAWSALDDAVVQPASVSSADYIYASGAGRRTEVTLQTTSLAGGTASVAGWFYANTGGSTQLTAEIVSGGRTLGSTTVAAGSGFGWRSVSATGVAQAGLDDLRLRFTTAGGGDSNVRAAYASATVTPGSSCTPAWGTFGPGAWPPACWRPFEANSPFNTRIPPNPRLIERADAIKARILGDISARDYPGHIVADPRGVGGEPTYYAQPGDPSYVIDCLSYGGNCTIDGMSVRIPAQAAPEGGWSAPAGADRHLTVVDQSTGWSYDMWQVRGSGLPAPGGTLQISFGGRSRIVGECTPGKPADGTNCEPDRSVGHGTAAHVAGLAGRVRVEELQAGRIDHALNIVLECDNGGEPVYPARGKGQPCANTVDAPPMGALLQLDMTPQQIDALPVQPWKKVFLRAMAEYGMYFGDTGSQNLFSIEVESGNQYTAFGKPDPWLAYGQANWEPYTSDGVTSYVAKLYNRPGDPDPNLDWMKAVWSHLRVLHPCVAERTC